VFAFSGDPAVAGIVQSWARPGVNRTGISYFSLELVAKRLELMRELLPRLRRVAIVGWPPHAGEQLELQAAQVAAERLGLVHRYQGATSAAEVDAALEAARAWRADAVLVFAGVVANAFADRFVSFSARAGIPSVSAWAPFAEAGNLMSYGPVLAEGQLRMAVLVDRLLRGENASDMPVEGPKRIEMVLNLKAARSLGLDVPRTLLSRADRVIE
jgi:putative tryptophan/tyrosine transport system substrate-binding protein